MSPPEIPQSWRLKDRKLDAATEDVLARILARVAQAGDPDLLHDVADEIERYSLLPMRRFGENTVRRINRVAELKVQGKSWPQIVEILDVEEDGAGESIKRDMLKRYVKPLRRRKHILEMCAQYRRMIDDPPD
jgi:hypothetical protein